MSYNVDFQIISNPDISGISLIVAQNEDAFSYLTDELNYTTLKDGSAPVFPEMIGDFISDAENAHLCCDYV